MENEDLKQNVANQPEFLKLWGIKHFLFLQEEHMFYPFSILFQTYNSKIAEFWKKLKLYGDWIWLNNQIVLEVHLILNESTMPIQGNNND